MSAAHDIARSDAPRTDGPVTRMSEPRITTELAVHGANDLAALDTGLAIASRAQGLTFIALTAPVIAPTAIVDEFRDSPLVSWSSVVCRCGWRCRCGSRTSRCRGTFGRTWR